MCSSVEEFHPLQGIFAVLTQCKRLSQRAPSPLQALGQPLEGPPISWHGEAEPRIVQLEGDSSHMASLKTSSPVMPTFRESHRHSWCAMSHRRRFPFTSKELEHARSAAAIICTMSQQECCFRLYRRINTFASHPVYVQHDTPKTYFSEQHFDAEPAARCHHTLYFRL